VADVSSHADPLPRAAATRVSSGGDVPALIVDRYLTVLSANRPALDLFPEWAPGANLVRLVFKNVLPRVSATQRHALQGTVAAMLRDSLDTNGADDAFVKLIGDLAVEEDDFSDRWADEAEATFSGYLVLDEGGADTHLSWQVFDLPGELGERVWVWGPSRLASSNR
jgi:hypothetical protein